MSGVRGKVAVVTGAGSGIGRQLALELARRGARPAVSDVDEAGLAETVVQLKALGADARSAVLDVSDRPAVEAYAAEVVEQFGVVHQIYNNAGVAGGGQTILEADWESYNRTLGVNLFGVINGTKAFLPHLIDSGDGHVVNISSLNGIMAQPTLSAYCAGKFAVRGFTETLRTEMILGKHPVGVTVVHPGGVKTGIASSSLREAQARGIEPTAEQLARVRLYNEKLLKMPADRAARIILDGVEAGKPRVLVGNDAKMVDRLVRLLPRLYPKLIVDFERKRFARL
ncbi:SDR family NAD(P)-dependent oxidoreductase [Amycolatopsis sp. lyj-112]|uniref:SDR family NAD(P)-dependent oxidoreductase n=1 Tax=Amycolatopsis sp. lyj-112 TaxID=2789288 RepID=UPI00397A34B9